MCQREKERERKSLWSCTCVLLCLPMAEMLIRDEVRCMSWWLSLESARAFLTSILLVADSWFWSLLDENTVVAATSCFWSKRKRYCRSIFPRAWNGFSAYLTSSGERPPSLSRPAPCSPPPFAHDWPTWSALGCLILEKIILLCFADPCRKEKQG